MPVATVSVARARLSTQNFTSRNEFGALEMMPSDKIVNHPCARTENREIGERDVAILTCVGKTNIPEISEMKNLFAVILVGLLGSGSLAHAAATGELKAGPQDTAAAKTEQDTKASKAAVSAKYKRLRAKAHRNAARAKANARALQLAGESR